MINTLHLAYIPQAARNFLGHEVHVQSKKISHMKTVDLPLLTQKLWRTLTYVVVVV
jgi:hypothetical protein